MKKINSCTIKNLCIGLFFLIAIDAAWADKVSKCSKYAQNSVLSHIANIKSECGFKGVLWNPGLRKHQKWCLDNSEFSRKKKVALRQQQLEQCGKTMQRDSPWAEIDFSIQNDLFGELITAIAMDDIDSLRLFEAQGVDLNFEWHIVDGGLLFWAISKQASLVSRYLIEEKAANPNLTANGGPNPLVKLLNNAPEVNYRLLDYLLRKGLRPNHGGEEFSDESFPITTAAMNNDLQSVRILLEYKANPNLYESVPPLMVAIYHNNSRMVDLLLKHGANQNRGLDGHNCKEIHKDRSTGDLLPMDAALKSGNTRIIKALSKVSAKTTAQCLSGS